MSKIKIDGLFSSLELESDPIPTYTFTYSRDYPEIRELFHKIWTSQVGEKGYKKKDWQRLQRLLGEAGINV